jgi:hypothetical protein
MELLYLDGMAALIILISLAGSFRNFYCARNSCPLRIRNYMLFKMGYGLLVAAVYVGTMLDVFAPFLVLLIGRHIIMTAMFLLLLDTWVRGHAEAPHG